MSAHTERYDYTRVFRDLTSGSHLFSFNGSSTTFGFVQVRRARSRPFKHTFHPSSIILSDAHSQSAINSEFLLYIQRSAMDIQHSRGQP